ncbi:MAG TPA: hypothetical protein DDW74_07310 [Porphyromonadaceae bacterium]|nr:hypothetical protein [Porphyromonadaceae bacterium]
MGFAALTICTSCGKEPGTVSPYIEGLSIYNFPVMDGSTSTLPLNTVIACELLGLNNYSAIYPCLPPKCMPLSVPTRTGCQWYTKFTNGFKLQPENKAIGKSGYIVN